MKKSLIPFINLIKQPQKFVLISLLFVLPFTTVIYYGYSDIEERINFVRKKKIGVEYIQDIKNLLQNAQQDRGMSNAYLSGDTFFEKKLQRKHTQIKDDIIAIDRIEKKYGEILKTTEIWSKIKQKWQKLEDRELSMTPRESFDAHTEFIADILSLIFYATNTSKLILDPYYDSYYMVDISINRIPLLTEELGKIRGLGAGAIASGAITAHEKIQLLKVSYSIKPAIDAIERSMQIIYQENPSLKPRLEDYFKNTIDSTNVFLAILNDRIINAGHIDIKPDDYFSLATTAIDANFNLFDSLTSALNELLQSRTEKIIRDRNYIGASLLIIFFFFFSVVVKFRNSLTAQLSAEENLLKSRIQL
ncbi:MAG: nitrate- and nitrite sensing domain-containing protein [Nitrospinae bacterium]|nr:nitrate- and nitrite sensing domain-containing protein [Nitrospinota bacterium]MBI3815773.1 nitrate- and nitrite sensing domain-containing protein [Nitrospinota bacterium]